MPASAAFLGRKIVVVRAGIVMDGVREKGIALNGEAVDVTSDENDGWRQLIDESGEDSVDITLSGITKNNDLKQEWFSESKIKTTSFTWPDGGVMTGSFRLGNYTETGPYKDATTFEVTLQSTGVIAYTPASG